jgi:hypothetical protein
VADSSRTGIRYKPESAWGTTPAGGWNGIRFTSESLKHATDTTQSEELRPDRNVADLIRTNVRGEGGINFELSYGAFDPLLEAVFAGTWTTNVLKNGTVPRSFSIEKHFTDGASFNAHHLFRGMRANNLSLNIRPGQVITGSLDFVGKDSVISGTAAAGSTTAAPTNDVMNAVDNITFIQEGGSAIDAVLGVELRLANNLRPQPAIGSFNIGVGYGRAVVTGTLEAYFRSVALFQKYVGFTDSSLLFTVALGGNSYTFEIPRIKFSDGDAAAGGNDQDVIVRLPFTALYHTGEACAIKLTRTPAG